jgi:membrane-bound lytic murein transglycosylase F
MKSKVKYFFFVLIFLFLQCKQVNNPSVNINAPSSLEIIRENGVLRVVTDYNSTSYFIYRGQPMGYQFELLQNLADYLNVKLEVTANNNMDDKFDMIQKGSVDLIAVNLTVTKERKKNVLFIEPHLTTRQVLVQRKSKNWKKLSEKSANETMINSQLELAGKTIHVQKNSSYLKRLNSLSDEIGEDIRIVETEYGVEQLIEKVVSGEIEYTVCDENVALVNNTYYDNIDISLPLSFSQNLAWAVKKGDIELKKAIDTWMSDFVESKRYAVIYNKYFKSKRTALIFESDYYVLNTGSISPYDEYVKEYSAKINWDWRLVTSMIYQESRFNPTAKSWAGAFGLMQLMPNTAKRYGVDSSSHPKLQINAGIKFLKWLDNLYENIEDPVERRKFVLASYNVGPGHVMDARKLAEKYGKNPDIWEDNVDGFLLKKSNAKYYDDPVVKYGYCRGKETYKYVSEVMERFEHYKNLVN